MWFMWSRTGTPEAQMVPPHPSDVHCDENAASLWRLYEGLMGRAGDLDISLLGKNTEQAGGGGRKEEPFH